MKKRAFTLIELIITIAIISLISSLILLKSGIIPKIQERKEIENLQADINYCREKSLVTGYNYKIIIRKNKYEIRRANDNELIKEVSFRRIHPEIQNTFIFRPTGSVGGAKEIYLTSSDRMYSIIISPIAGRVRYE
ncbi:MAG: prepilin-type N-terminal cleavage/methylation domain-containing protein [Anaerococcus vaginalis]|nr:prepilin-type N-terminal cleavage/methylation domain-containing protein [Anaerococcus vaginalis]